MDTLLMSPQPADRLVRFVGDTIRFSLSRGPAVAPNHGWSARLRTTLGRGRTAREEVVQAHACKIPPFGARWHDVPLAWDGSQWTRDIVVTEAGYFAAKPYLIDPHGYQHWPEGPDVGLSVHPDWTRTANTLYCAFTRLFGKTRSLPRSQPEASETTLRDLEKQGYAILPPSGTFRDLARQLPHIVGHLGCRILHLLPIHPTPTTFARFGRFGSPYAALDLTAVDPALVEFDQRTTGVEQFEELTRAAHHHGARVFLDVVINHTGWGSRLLEEHPEFFRREADGRFASPGAWGTVWEDLVELEQQNVALWDALAESLLIWCRRGVDGFRCDAGYKIPTHVWQYITARVHDEFPETVFLLEGLGGSWESTEALLTEGGMQWAYSELFQNYSGEQVQWYLDYALRQSHRLGTYIHYSETHDNDRLAVRGRAWSLLRNRLCALTSVNGGFGFTCGVEWLASEKILVHQCTGLGWDAPGNIVPELIALNRLLASHPAFFDGAELVRLSPAGAPFYALRRRAADPQWQVVVLANLSTNSLQTIGLAKSDLGRASALHTELLGQPIPPVTETDTHVTLTLPPATVLCLSDRGTPPESFGEEYRADHARLAWALRMASALVPAESLSGVDLRAIAPRIAEDAPLWLATLSEACTRSAQEASPTQKSLDLAALASRWHQPDVFPCVVVWRPEHARRITLVPPGWWLVALLDSPGLAHLRFGDDTTELHERSIPVDEGHLVAFPPRNPDRSTPATLRLNPFDSAQQRTQASLCYLPDPSATAVTPALPNRPDGLVLLTNGRGGMARLRIHFGTVRSKYDAALAANLHPAVPVDRHVLAKRVRAWLNADGFISPLDGNNLIHFSPGPPATWTFRANAGDARCALVTVEALMPELRNTVLFRISRSADDVPLHASLTLRVDLEDRSYHAETRRNAGAEHHFSRHSHTLGDLPGFEFRPATDRRIRVVTASGRFHRQPEWSENILHPIEASRGQAASGDAYSPGWFEVPLAPGEHTFLTLDAEPPSTAITDAGVWFKTPPPKPASNLAGSDTPPPFETQLTRAIDAYIVQRDHGKTIIAGYPWFLDWGRDTLIAARGLLAAGRQADVDAILHVFARFADRGTLPNAIHGENASNRDTSDAPLWFVRVVEEASAGRPREFLHHRIPGGSRSLLEVARDLAQGYLDGAPNGIRVDPDSALVWSPSHFTWMDTNHPAGTPREGYPVEIQALWIAALRFLGREDAAHAPRWNSLAERASLSFQRFFWMEDLGWFADVLLGHAATPAAKATRDTALRCNVLIALTLGMATASQAQQCVDAALRHLLVPGAVRSLAPLPVSPPLPIRGHDGQLLNDPEHPYWGRYEGDEDTRRKPAYHNGTAWTWFLPLICEAFALAWNHHPEAIRASKAILLSASDLLASHCLGHLPEILDGDAPHSPRGCDAQAWSVTETLRVWKRLSAPPPRTG